MYLQILIRLSFDTYILAYNTVQLQASPHCESSVHELETRFGYIMTMYVEYR
jgi:hypothetical protein